MKATINGIEVEGTPEELAEFIVGQPAQPVQRQSAMPVSDTIVQHAHRRARVKRRRKRTVWTAKENAYLMANYDRLGYKRIAKELGRGQGAVRVHMSGLRKHAPQHQSSPSKPRKHMLKGARDWTPEEIQVMQQSKDALMLQGRKVRKRTLKALAKQFNRTKKAVTLRANMLGLSLYRWGA
jgi:hypothetical protein